MSIHHYPGRLVFVTASSSVLLLAFSVVVAVYLNSQQAQTAEILGENIGSRRAAANLREVLTDLIALHEAGTTDPEPLHERVRFHLAEIERLADKDAEKPRAARVRASFAQYLALWEKRGTRGDAAAVRHLATSTLPACDDLREYNAGEIEKSELEHRRTLRWLAGGFIVVGVMGSAAGLLLGYGLARGLRRAVDSLLVHIQGASDMLGQELATVEWQRNGVPLQDGVADLTMRVEQVVSQLQQREREVRRSERLAAVGQLAAGVAHEIRNPLTSVQLLVQTARRDPSAGGLTDEELALIDDELGRIEHSLQTFMEYARPPRLERGPCSLPAVIESGLALVRGRASQQHVELRVEVPPAPIVLNADASQLRQVVVNLLLNALDAMPAGGVLEVATHREGPTVEFTVRDTGPGIPADILPRLFEPFASGKETGLGLGLVISKRIVEDHGGAVRGFNRPGAGATFVVTLPAAT